MALRLAMPTTALVRGFVAVLSINAAAKALTDPARTAGPTRNVQRIEQRQLEAMLVRVGCEPKSLTAAGLSVPQAVDVVHKAREFLAASADQVNAADNEYQSAKAAEGQLQRRAQSGAANQDAIAALNAARERLTEASAARQRLLDRAFDACLAAAPPEAIERLRIILANRAMDLPVQYLVVRRTDAQWSAIREAYAAQRASQRRGTTADPQSVAALASENLGEETSAAANRLQANLAATTTAWRSALADQQ